METTSGSHAKVHCCFVCSVATTWRATLARSVAAGNGLSSDSSSENTTGSTRFSRGADCSLSGPTPGPGPGSFHLSSRSHSVAAVAREKQKSEGQGPCRCCGEATLGSKRAGVGRSARCRKTPSKRHSMDYRLGKRVPGAAERRDGCRAAHAQESSGQRQFEIDRAAAGGNQSHRKQERDHSRTSES